MEAATHFKVVQFMYKTGKRMDMKSISLATAAHIYHKFFSNCKLDDYDPYTIGAACLSLSGKVSEQHVRIRDVINCAHKTLLPTESPPETEAEYQQLRDSVASCELLLMRMLKFKVAFDLPHKYLLHYLRALQHWFNPSVWDSVPLADTCWTLLSDSYHSNLSTRHAADHIATAVIYLGLECCGVSVPLNDDSEFKWWEVFSDDVTEEKLMTIVREVMAVYNLETQEEDGAKGAGQHPPGVKILPLPVPDNPMSP